jgi:Rps23 Pro-64 3,4-dihydroxylase Tpa1-like proline 4-hydroxylase
MTSTGSEVLETQRSQPLRAPFLIVDDFLENDLADEMRRDIDSHFANPRSHRPNTHQVWNYWYVPDLYTYMRTLANKVIQAETMDRFMVSLRNWTAENLGMIDVERPWLSLYVTGCKQGLHNDASNGRFAFVYSLTRKERKFSGGETIILNEGDLFRDKVRTPASGSGLYSAIEPRFNRLVIFDDRMPHGVQEVEGIMDPAEGRLVLHGHIRESGPIVSGALPIPAVGETLTGVLQAFAAKAGNSIAAYHGPFVVRFTVDGGGSVTHTEILVDRVAGPDADDAGAKVLTSELAARVNAATFPASGGPTTITQPFLFGGGLPQRPPGV